jgi:hypothetical protein
MPISARLPGIEFDVVSPPTEETLVRMDIAVFVGLAASGPLHLPVAVESIPEFEQLFGADLLLATESNSKQPVYAYMPSAVRAFFRNGGSRCWIVRVGGGPESTGQFKSKLFLDSRLADSSVEDLLSDAEAILAQGGRSTSPSGPLLLGIHSALEIEEATILCVPDAVQRGWEFKGSDAIPSPVESSPLQHPEWWHFLDCWNKPEIPRVTDLPTGQFQPCDLRKIPAPILSATPAVKGNFTLTWDTLPDFTAYLEEADDPEFKSAGVIFSGLSGSKTLYGRPPGVYFYRVRRQSEASSSDYSNGVAVQVAVAAGWQATSIGEYQPNAMLEVHRAVLHMCAARGDLFAILTLPSHYREADAASYAEQLIHATDISALSFGALYHPWLIGHEENDMTAVRANPPDGAITGTMAARSADRGAWVSPANEPLHGVVALTPVVAETIDSHVQLQVAQINPITQEPEGFLCLSEFTLASDSDLQPINVRRLLSFLRKEALRAGVDYVFEPNGDEFRRAVERGFEKLLDRLFLRGAFSGRIAREAYQVVAESGLNAKLQDRGQFVVELRVAPSVPMRFLKIRLLQTADRTFVTEGR